MKLVDLFSGAGGLSCGLKMAGFEPIFACEINPTYAKTYQHNHPNIPICVRDIKTLDSKHIVEATGIKKGELDLLAGGPPCQGFSINAPIRTLEDTRNQLVTDFIRIAEGLMPRFLLIENVTGIISLGKGRIVEEIYSKIGSLGYTINHAIMFAGYYGVPQIRFRTIFLASRDGEAPIFPFPTHNATARANFTGARGLIIEPLPLERSNLQPATTVDDAISDLIEIESGFVSSEMPYKTPPKTSYQKQLRNGKAEVANHYTTRLSEANLQRLRHIPQGGSWRDIPVDLLPEGMKRARRSDHTKRYGRLHPQGQCSTILTKCDPHWGSFFHPYENRVISVREAARFQSFPDHFEFLGSMTEQYAQVGNAVPPFLARAIGQKIRDAAA